jgi:hypothetical protein
MYSLYPLSSVLGDQVRRWFGLGVECLNCSGPKSHPHKHGKSTFHLHSGSSLLQDACLLTPLVTLRLFDEVPADGIDAVTKAGTSARPAGQLFFQATLGPVFS